MSACQHCTRKTQLPLCTPCTHNLATLLAELNLQALRDENAMLHARLQDHEWANT